MYNNVINNIRNLLAYKHELSNSIIIYNYKYITMKLFPLSHGARSVVSYEKKPFFKSANFVTIFIAAQTL